MDSEVLSSCSRKITFMELSMNPERALNASSVNLSITAPSGRFKNAVWNSLNATVNKTLTRCNKNVKRPGDIEPDKREIQLTFNPNLTLIRETTEITIGAY